MKNNNNLDQKIKEAIKACTKYGFNPNEDIIKVLRKEFNEAGKLAKTTHNIEYNKYFKTKETKDGKTVRTQSIEDWDKLRDQFVTDTEIKKINQILLDKDMKVINKAKIETLVHEKIDNISPKLANDIARKVYFGTPNKELLPNKEEIVFKNGKYNLIEKEFTAGEFESLNVIPWDYNPNAKSELGRDVINRYIGDNIGFDTQVFEVLGLMMIQDKDMGQKKTVFFDGPSDYAKSFLTEKMLQPVLGMHNCTQIDSNELDAVEFAKLINKTAAFDDDMDRGMWNTKSVSNFKKLSGSSKLKAKLLYQDTFDFENYATLWINCNGLPEFKDNGSGGALTTRMHVIKATVNIKEKYSDPTIFKRVKEKQQEISEWLIVEAIKALENALERGYLTETKMSKEAMTENMISKNPVYAWMESYDWEEWDKFEKVHSKSIKALYQEFNDSFVNGVNYGKSPNKFKITKFTEIIRDNQKEFGLEIFVSGGYKKVRRARGV